jgi:hypothetical protein
VGRPVMRPWSAALAALFVLLSGCSGSPEPGLAPGTPPGEAKGDAVADLALAPLALAADVPLSGTMAIEDGFPTGETCNFNPGGGCVERPHDLGAFLPEGVPMKVTLDLTWQPGDGIFHMEAWVDGEGMTWLRVDEPTLEPGHWQWTAVVLPGAESTAFVISGGPQSAAQAGSSSPYRLDINFTASNQTVPEAMPVALEMGPNSTFEVRSTNGGAAGFLLYGPDDLLLQEAEGELTLPAEAARGDYIVMPAETAVILVPGGGELRFVRVAFTYSDEVTVPSGGGSTVSVSSTTPPFLAGAYFYGQQQTPVMVSVEMRVTLTDPDGAALVTESACQPFCAGGFSESWSMGFGVPLKAGSYTLTVDSQGSQDTYAGAYLATFDRSSV